MEGLHYSFGIACIWVSHKRLLKRLIVELLHIFGYLGKTQEKLPFSQEEEIYAADVPEGQVPSNGTWSKMSSFWIHLDSICLHMKNGLSHMTPAPPALTNIKNPIHQPADSSQHYLRAPQALSRR